MSAHKLYGPKGTGALFIRKGTRITPHLHGGEQEKNRRASTENVPGIVGFGKAVELAQQELDEERERLSRLRDYLITGILDQIDNAQLNGHPVKRLPNNVNISFDFVEGESICLNLDLEGICASTGSACSSSSLEPSHVLLAMGFAPEQARSSLRLTSGKWTGHEDIDRVLEVLPRVISRLRSISPLLQSNR
jgi:cysteine desulfurase